MITELGLTLVECRAAQSRQVDAADTGRAKQGEMPLDVNMALI